MEKKENLFEGSIGAYHRGWFGFLFEVSLSNFGENKCKKLFHKFPNVNREITIDLMKYLCAAGFMEGADDSPVTYDGSRIDHVTTRRIGSDEENVFLKDFSVLRSKNQVAIEDGLLEIEQFLIKNLDLMEELSAFQGSFWEVYPFGIFRCESLLSMIDLDNMNIKQYLEQLSINFKERKRLFGHSFASVHASTGIPIDHDSKRNIFHAKGYHWHIGNVLVGDKEKDVFLRIGLGDGEGYMGMSMAIAIENPNAAFFKVAYQMIIDKGGLVIPQFITAQVSPMQINDELQFVPGFLPHEDFPSKDSLFEIQAVVTKLLGGGNIFDTMIVALINYYRAEGCNTFAGIKGEDNLWLRYHADEVIESHSGANRTIAKRASKIYCNRFDRLGFSRVNGWWMSDDFVQTMKSALSFRQTGTRNVKVVCRCDGRNVTRRVNLPVAEVCVSESGLAKLGERIFDELPLSNGEICLHDIFSLLNIFKSVKKQSLALCCVR